MVVISRDEVATCSKDGRICFWSIDTTNFKVAMRLIFEDSEFIYSLSTLNRGSILASAGGQGVNVFVDGRFNQNLPIPGLSTCVQILDNSDIAVGSSNSRIYIFTQNPQREASEELIALNDAEVSRFEEGQASGSGGVQDGANAHTTTNGGNQPQIQAARQRRTVKMARKESKNVKSITVTQGNAEEYDIEDELKKLGISEVPSEKSKRKQKKKGKKKNSAKEDVNVVDQGVQDQPTSDQPVEAQDDEDVNVVDQGVQDQPTLDQPVEAHDDEDQEHLLEEVQQNNSSTNKKPTEVPSEPECSTCFEPRTRTFALVPCGHATFCEKCATFFCEIEDKNSRKCPTCRKMITGKVRVFS